MRRRWESVGMPMVQGSFRVIGLPSRTNLECFNLYISSGGFNQPCVFVSLSAFRSAGGSRCDASGSKTPVAVFARTHVGMLRCCVFFDDNDDDDDG